MLDEKDLQAIAALMDSRMAQQKKEIINEVKVLMEADVMPKFNLLADGIQAIQEKMVPAEAIDEIEDRLDVLEATVRLHSKEIAKLKKAQ